MLGLILVMVRLKLKKKKKINHIHFLIKILNDFPKMIIEISGHTDNRGSNSYNKRLSLARAKAVKDYLIQKGIDGERLKVKGFGEEQSIAPNNSDEGRRINRRVEFKIISK